MMQSGGEDRRVQRTRQLLRQALVELILEKGYEAVTVQDILDRANFGRSTFYTHYQGKEDLLLSGFEHIKKTFEEHTTKKSLDNAKPGVESSISFSLALFHHAAAYHQLYKAMVGKQSGNIFLKQLDSFLESHIQAQFDNALSVKPNPTIPNEVIVRYLVATLLSLLTWWLDHDLPYKAEQMDAMFQQLSQPSLKTILG